MIGLRQLAFSSNKEIALMSREANEHRDVLRQTIEEKLDASATKQATTAKETREEVTGYL